MVTTKSRWREIERSWLSDRKGSVPPPDRATLAKRPKVQLTTRGLAVAFRCPHCSRVEMIPFAKLGISIETACRRGKVTVVQRISESED